MTEAENAAVRLSEWLVPLAFITCAAWVVWHMPAYILDLANIEEGSAFDRLSAQYIRADLTPNMSGFFGGFIDIIDLLTLIGVPLFGVIGVRTVRRANMEQFEW
ncbi:MAG: hypothetical protein OEX14_07850, partial [Paracoccaceae bacterium]|nr:hypothetical protein [Paracoccaceae bacterium]